MAAAHFIVFRRRTDAGRRENAMNTLISYNVTTSAGYCQCF